MYRKSLFIIFVLLIINAATTTGQDKPGDNKAKTIVTLIPPVLKDWHVPVSENYFEVIKNVFHKQNAYIVQNEEEAKDSFLRVQTANPGKSLSDQAKLTGKQMKSEIVVYGTIEQQETAFNIEMSVINPKTGLIEFTYSKRAPLKAQIPVYLEEFSVDAIRKYSDIKTSKIFLKSLLVPGLGQFQAGHKIRGLMFFAGTFGMIGTVWAMPDGDPYHPQEVLQVLAGANGNAYYWGTREVSHEEYNAETNRRFIAKTSQDDAKKKKRYVIFGATFLYVYNLIDALIITKEYNQKIFHNRVAFNIFPNPTLSLRYRF